MGNKLLHKGFCPVCGQPILHVKRMKDGSICTECAAKVRVLFPVHYEKSTVKGYNSTCVDPLQDAAVNDYEAILKKAKSYRESLREKYNGYNAVYVVDNVELDNGSGAFPSPVVNVYGRVLYGTFFIDDEATLLHGVLWISCNGCFDSTDTDYPTMKLDSASGVVYNHFIALEDRGWNKSDSVAFNLPLFEHDADLNVTITVRYTNRYPYQNLQLVAFLAEIDTTNIITTLPLQQNDELIDSLIHRQDSLSQEKEKKEQKINERKAERDSLSQESDSLSTSKKADTASNDSVDHSKADSLSKTKDSNTSADTVRTGDADKKESLLAAG